MPLALALAACGPGDAASAPAANLILPAGISTSPSLPPWKQEADCYWVLTYPDGVAHRAWISSNKAGVFLSIVDDSIRSWPVSDSLSINLVADGAEGSVAARGQHGDEDSATLLTIILDEPQRALVAGAESITMTSEGRPGFTLPMAGFPARVALDACDIEPGPGKFSQE